MFDIALENTMKEEVCCKLSDLLAQEEGLELPPGVEIPMYILTTNDKRLGASMLLNVAALTRIAEELHSNLFIYPSSIHEVLVLPVEGTRKQRAKQKKMVEEVNASSVSPEERLSNSVYYFDREKQEVTIGGLGETAQRIEQIDTEYSAINAGLLALKEYKAFLPDAISAFSNKGKTIASSSTEQCVNYIDATIQDEKVAEFLIDQFVYNFVDNNGLDEADGLIVLFRKHVKDTKSIEKLVNQKFCNLFILYGCIYVVYTLFC